MISKKLFLYFPTSETEKPVIYHLVKDHNLVISILRAKITPDEHGYMVLEASGEESDIKEALEFLKVAGIEVNEKERGIRREDSKCTDCGNCVPHCPTGALSIEDKGTMKVEFDSEKCIHCLNCIENCPFGAMVSLF